MYGVATTPSLRSNYHIGPACAKLKIGLISITGKIKKSHWKQNLLKVIPPLKKISL